ncbi:hypothetical protein Sjap_021975 [Stephania japonica]|uniref:Uncharacterized protein n=1 Tax=Stephania japonica TaxID=461633 RepID=A0AAP0HPG3_9MAGN
MHPPSLEQMQGLTLLKQLEISGCLCLKKACDNVYGDPHEWPKISYIPHLNIY